MPCKRLFLAWVGDRPAAAASVSMHGLIALLGGASTRVDDRQRGMQTALIEARLDAGRAAGCTIALVHSDPGKTSERNITRRGFRLAYTKLLCVLPD